MDRRSGRDRGPTGQEAKDRSRGCQTSAEADARRSLSENLGTESRESRSATTAVAPTSDGADAHADHEPTSSAGHERREALEVEAVEQTGTSRIRSIGVRSLGQSTPERVVGAAGPAESEHRGVNDSRRAGSQKSPRSVAADDASRRGPDYGTRLCVDHRNPGAVRSWQADRHVRWDDSD